MIASTASTMMMITSLLEPLILMLNGYLEAQHLDYTALRVRSTTRRPLFGKKPLSLFTYTALLCARVYLASFESCVGIEESSFFEKRVVFKHTRRVKANTTVSKTSPNKSICEAEKRAV